MGIASSGTPRRRTEVLGRRRRRCCKCRCGCRRVRNATRRWCGHLRRCDIEPNDAMSREDNTGLVTLFVIISTPLFLSDMWFGVTPRTDTKETSFRKRLDSCSKYNNHSRLGSQQYITIFVNLGLFRHFETVSNIRTWIISHRYWRML